MTRFHPLCALGLHKWRRMVGYASLLYPDQRLRECQRCRRISK